MILGPSPFGFTLTERKKNTFVAPNPPPHSKCPTLKKKTKEEKSFLSRAHLFRKNPAHQNQFHLTNHKIDCSFNPFLLVKISISKTAPAEQKRGEKGGAKGETIHKVWRKAKRTKKKTSPIFT